MTVVCLCSALRLQTPKPAQQKGATSHCALRRPISLELWFMAGAPLFLLVEFAGRWKEWQQMQASNTHPRAHTHTHSSSYAQAYALACIPPATGHGDDLSTEELMLASLCRLAVLPAATASSCSPMGTSPVVGTGGAAGGLGSGSGRNLLVLLASPKLHELQQEKKHGPAGATNIAHTAWAAPGWTAKAQLVVAVNHADVVRGCKCLTERGLKLCTLRAERTSAPQRC
eukprot:1157779-Pelagomonas_calceolata.AAC.21